MKYSIGGFSSVLAASGKNNYNVGFDNFDKAGIVYGVITTENTPTKKQFERAGGFSAIGSVFYKNYNESKNTVASSIDDGFLDTCFIARPYHSQVQHYPLLGEIIGLSTQPTPATLNAPTSIQMYYTVLNLWNNSQQNSNPANDNASLGNTFIENPNIRPLLSFEGDYITQGRQGSALRFSSTTKLHTDLNEWSSIGKDDDPITILTNGFNYDPNGNFYVEKINKDLSSIYLTSAQKIPLQTDKTGVLNNLTNPLNAPDYTNAQVIINSDRVVLNSKKDEVMLFAKTNIELNTKNTINLNADERIHLNSKAVFLGPFDSSHTPQPLLLGDNTYNLLKELVSGLYSFGTALSAVVGSPEGAPALDIKAAADDLLNSLDRITDDLSGILSQQNYTV